MIMDEYVLVDEKHSMSDSGDITSWDDNDDYVIVEKDKQTANKDTGSGRKANAKIIILRPRKLPPVPPNSPTIKATTISTKVRENFWLPPPKTPRILPQGTAVLGQFIRESIREDKRRKSPGFLAHAEKIHSNLVPEAKDYFPALHEKIASCADGIHLADSMEVEQGSSIVDLSTITDANSGNRVPITEK